MSFSPIHAGQIEPPLFPQLMKTNGTLVPLTGITSYALKIRDRKTNRTRTGGGAFTVFDPTNSILEYTWVQSDTAIPGSYMIYVIYYYSPTDYGTTIEQELEIQPLN